MKQIWKNIYYKNETQLHLSRYSIVWRSARKLQFLLKLRKCSYRSNLLVNSLPPNLCQHLANCSLCNLNTYFYNPLSLGFSGWSALCFPRLSYFLTDRRKGNTIINLVCISLTLFSLGGGSQNGCFKRIKML